MPSHDPMQHSARSRPGPVPPAGEHRLGPAATRPRAAPCPSASERGSAPGYRRAPGRRAGCACLLVPPGPGLAGQAERALPAGPGGGLLAVRRALTAVTVVLAHAGLAPWAVGGHPALAEQARHGEDEPDLYLACPPPRRKGRAR